MTKYKLKSLDDIVSAALDFFSKNEPVKLGTKEFKFPLVVGSGNAYHTGKIIFGNQAALFATESNFKEILHQYYPLIKEKMISEVVVISASGEKDALWEVELAKKSGLKTVLITCSGESSAAKVADQVFTYRKLPEPYTYNTSTYLGMILSATSEKAENIKKVIKKIKVPRKFKQYQSYSFILPDKFANLAPMLDIKRHELFGPKVSLRAFSFGEARHAKFVVRDKKELVISFGKNLYFGEPDSRWEINLPDDSDYGTYMAFCYHLVGLIQKSKPDYYKKNIIRFCNNDGYKAYNSNDPFDVVVPGN
jgi:SIS domain